MVIAIFLYKYWIIFERFLQAELRLSEMNNCFSFIFKIAVFLVAEQLYKH